MVLKRKQNCIENCTEKQKNCIETIYKLSNLLSIDIDIIKNEVARKIKDVAIIAKFAERQSRD